MLRQVESLTSNKQGRQSVIVDRIGYDKEGHMVYTKLGNGTETTYTYDKQRERLQAMNLTADGQTVMENRYRYDAVDNILGITNAANPTSLMKLNKAKLGGRSSHTYEYDELNRLVHANGKAKRASYDMVIWIQTPHPNTTPDTSPGPPVSWNDPSNPNDPQAGYGYIPNDTTKEVTFFYHSDHLGSTSYITDDKANITQYDAYLPYGELLVDEHSSSEDLPYKFNGKQFDEETGLYYYGARYLNPVTSLWYGVDPMAEKYMTIGAYVYCVSNPIRFLDLIGKEPGDFFESMDLAAIDFGKYYNASSIKENREYATLIYETKDRWGNIAYSYNTPLKGTQDSSKPSTDGLPKDAIVRAIAHTHGEDLANYDNENFSPTDIKTYKYFDGYVVTPKGKLKHYNHITKKQNIVATKRLPYSLKKGSNGRTKVIGNVYYHKKGFKTATERRVAWYKNKMKESWYDRYISSTLHPIEKVSKQ